jgi:hypothetical protein
MTMSSVVIGGQLAGWEGEVRGRLLLNDATISLGPPQERADLRPDSVSDGKHYERLSHQPDAHARWLTCFYGQGNEFVLATPLPAGVDVCVIRKGRGRDNVVQVGVICRP